MAANVLNIRIFDKPEDAPTYKAPTKAIEVKEAIIVRRGTMRGKATIDLVCTDSSGNEYVLLVTAAVLDMASNVAKKA